MPTSTASSNRGGLAPVITIWLVFGMLFSCLALLRHASFHTYAYDLGLHHQAVWNTLHGRFFDYSLMDTEKGPLPNLLGDHVNLILLLAVPFYLIHDGAGTLLVLQAIVATSAVVPLFLLGRSETGSPLAGGLLVLAYLLHPGFQAALLYDFHAVVPGATFLVWAFWLARCGSDRGLAVAVALALASQEDLSLAVVCLGAVVFLQGRRRAGVLVAVAGFLWLAVCFLLVLPHFNPAGSSSHFARYRYLGETPTAILRHLVTRTGIFFWQAAHPQTLRYLRDLVAPWGFLPLLSPIPLLLGASDLALNVFSSFPPQRSIDFHYSAVVFAALGVAAPAAVARATKLLSPRASLSPRAVAAFFGAGAVAATLVFQVRIYGGLRMFSPPYLATYAVTDHARLGHDLLSAIPGEASVCAQNAIAPHLNRRKLFVFPYVLDADYVVLDQSSEIFPVHLSLLPGLGARDSYLEYVRRLQASGSFETIRAGDGWLLLRRVITR